MGCAVFPGAGADAAGWLGTITVLKLLAGPGGAGGCGGLTTKGLGRMVDNDCLGLEEEAADAATRRRAVAAFVWMNDGGKETVATE